MTEVVAVVVEPDTTHMHGVGEATACSLGLIGVEVPRREGPSLFLGRQDPLVQVQQTRDERVIVRAIDVVERGSCGDRREGGAAGEQWRYGIPLYIRCFRYMKQRIRSSET